MLCCSCISRQGRSLHAHRPSRVALMVYAVLQCLLSHGQLHMRQRYTPLGNFTTRRFFFFVRWSGELFWPDSDHLCCAYGRFASLLALHWLRLISGCGLTRTLTCQSTSSPAQHLILASGPRCSIRSSIERVRGLFWVTTGLCYPCLGSFLPDSPSGQTRCPGRCKSWLTKCFIALGWIFLAAQSAKTAPVPLRDLC